jgi:hypothetical protein
MRCSAAKSSFMRGASWASWERLDLIDAMSLDLHPIPFLLWLFCALARARVSVMATWAIARKYGEPMNKPWSRYP